VCVCVCVCVCGKVSKIKLYLIFDGYMSGEFQYLVTSPVLPSTPIMCSQQGPFLLLRLRSTEYFEKPYTAYVIPEITDELYQYLRKAEGLHQEDIADVSTEKSMREAYVMISYYLSEYEGDDYLIWNLSEEFGEKCISIEGNWLRYEKGSLLSVNANYYDSIKETFTIDHS